MTIRAARPADLPRLQRIEVAAGAPFRELGMPEIADDAPPSLATLERHRQAGLAWVCTLPDDTPVAYLIAERVDGGLHIEQVSVDPSHAHQGLGRTLIAHATTHARTEGAKALTLTTFTEVPWNAPYYERLGFEEIPPAALPPGLRKIRAEEAAAGLDRWPRQAMRRRL
ncbi:GNAT family N-acetyltransferase [Streptomyces evansiae]|uniref:GNAT family N-acetyltransferase n=1 Tax=Streptomyces evansiae TaxID=3075535 RepID=UPI0028875E82|nr:GNAT family N-acetyltransferase [Streptomyces sp. DSM 41859]MDT0421847.1 GNAT family N-acetyltransferase [Streptomyces sp. DSM 41859]